MSCRLVGGTLGATHMALTLVSLAEGHVDTHVHSYETGFFVLEGAACPLPRWARCHARARCVRRRSRRRPARVPLRRPRALARDGRATAPRRRKRHVLPRACTGTSPRAARRPRPAEPQPVPAHRGRDGPRPSEGRGQTIGAPTVSASMATAVLAYSGIAVKMLVDQRLDAQLHTMFMVDYQPGAVRAPARPPVRGVVLHARGRGRRGRERRSVHAPTAVTCSGRRRGACTPSTKRGEAGCGGSRRRRPHRRRATRTGSSGTGTTSPERLASDASVGVA